MWWEEDDNLVSRWIAETIAMKRSEVTQGIHKRFLGELSTGISKGRLSLTIFLFTRYIDQALWAERSVRSWFQLGERKISYKLRQIGYSW